MLYRGSIADGAYVDERLNAGRRHLFAGRSALQGPRPREGREHFLAALRAYRGPAALIGEAHARCGLAEIDLVEGAVPTAEARLTEAFAGYDEAISRLDAGEETLHREAILGRTMALVIQAQLWLRTGRRIDAETQLTEAGRTLDRMGDLRGQVEVQLTLARCALVRGTPDPAEAAIRKAIAGLLRLDDRLGLVKAWLFLGEVSRAERRLEAADEATSQALALARAEGDADSIGRALAALGTVRVLQARAHEAEQAFDEALSLLGADSQEATGLARLGRGELWARQGRRGATAEFVAAVSLLAGAGLRQGTAGALLKLADHALEGGLPVFGLALAEAARQWSQLADPIRGVGLAQRLQVKALASLKQWPAVVTLAGVRAELVGHVQPGANEIDAHYRSRAPQALLDELAPLSLAERTERAERHVRTVLTPLLERLAIDFGDLGTGAATQALAEATTTAAPRTVAPRSTTDDNASDPSYSPATDSDP